MADRGHRHAERESAVGPAPAWLPAGAAPRVLARIWATVDLERALADLGAAGDRARDATDDPHLGARVLILAPDAEDPAGGPRGVAIALAEPSTEGRLAAHLARHDEGPAGHYLAAPVDLAALRPAAAAAGVVLSRPADGPFGRSVLVVDRPAGRAFVILVELAAVPSRP